MGAKDENIQPEYVLKLFVSGASPNSVRAINNLKAICEAHMKANYNLQIIDVYQDTALLAQEEQIVALPLLVKKFPLPERKLVGDMSNTPKVLVGLGLAI